MRNLKKEIKYLGAGCVVTAFFVIICIVSAVLISIVSKQVGAGEPFEKIQVGTTKMFRQDFVYFARDLSRKAIAAAIISLVDSVGFAYLRKRIKASLNGVVK